MKNLNINLDFSFIKNHLKKLFILSLLIFFSTKVSSQKNLDSLKSVWQDPIQHDTMRAKAIKDFLIAGYLYSQPDSSFILIDSLYQFAKSAESKKYQGLSFEFKGVVCLTLGKFEEGKRYFLESISLYEELDDDSRIASSKVNLTQIYKSLGEQEKALETIREVERYGRKNDDPYTHCQSLFILYEIFDLRNESDSISLYLNKAYEVAKKEDFKEMQGIALKYLGSEDARRNNYIQGLDKLYKAVDLLEGQKNIGQLFLCYDDIAAIHRELKNFDKALKYSNRCLQIAEETNSLKHKGWAYFSLGQLYDLKLDFDKGFDYYKKARGLCMQTGDFHTYMSTTSTIIPTYVYKDSFSYALKLIEEFGEIIKQVNEPQAEEIYFRTSSLYYWKINNIPKAIDFGEKALATAQELGKLINISQSGDLLYQVYKQNKDYKKALNTLELLTVTRDSINKKENLRAAFSKEYQYEYDKQALADSLEFAQKEAITNLQLENNEATLSQQRLALIATILGLLLLGTLAYFFYQSKKRQEAEADRVKELDAFKSTFYTNITHEFRTPLTVILGMAKQIEERPQQYLDEGIKLIKRNGKNLLGQINQILDLSKLETNSLQLNIIQGDVIEFLRYSTEAFQSYANGQNLSLRFFSPVEKLQMDYDPDTIQNIMSNLISNAMKFTPSGGDVKVLLENDDEQLTIKVQDSGVGISEKDLPHIFDRFYQVKNLNGSEVYGTGVGLAYVQELVKVIEGNISVKSEVGKGTTFVVNLPIRRIAAIAENGISKVETQRWKPIQKRVDVVGDTKISSSKIDSTLNTNENLPNLLIIEDNADVVIYLKSCLSDLYQIEVAYNGKIGIEKALETIPDLIISDVMMPEKDGFEVCDILKNDEKTSHIPLVLLTAKADSTSKIAGLKRGADAYLSKPFDKEELLVRLELLVERQKKMATYFSKNNFA
ncbi:MAG: ATP-binding protein, partial [Saprospiraceae bacterium]